MSAAMTRPPQRLGAVGKTALIGMRYKPKPKSEPAKRRKRRAAKNVKGKATS